MTLQSMLQNTFHNCPFFIFLSILFVCVFKPYVDERASLGGGNLQDAGHKFQGCYADVVAIRQKPLEAILRVA